MKPSKSLLLVEDDLSLGELLTSVFAKTGHGVTWFCRARIQDANLVLMDTDGNENVFKTDSYELALVDFRLKGSPLDGPEVTAFLVKAGLPVVAISGLPSLNDVLIQAGARGGISKDQLFSRVLRKEVVIDRTFMGS
jgi:DNA-binding response OmpR family regulator